MMLLLFLLFLQIGVWGQVSYVPLWDNTSFDERVIDLSLPVGATAGSHAITPTGAATYSIPLVCPTKATGVHPSLSISYNSQGGDGLMGMGWSLGGLSVISRIGSDIMHEGIKTGVEGDKADIFALDGGRLVMDNPSNVYGGNNVTYSTESESFSRTTSYGNVAGGPAWFKVETKSGLTYEYGNNTTAKYQKLTGTGQNGEVLIWMLNKVYDAYGNYVLFNYTSPGYYGTHHCPRIANITYTGSSAGANPPHMIDFIYKERIDENTGYLAETPFSNGYLMTDIVVERNQNLFRKYHLSYGFDGLHSFLTEVQEQGQNGDKFNSTIFKYGDLGQSFVGTNTNTDIKSYQGWVENGSFGTGDFNGDGYTDMISFTGPIVTNDNVNLPSIDKYRIFLKSKITNEFDLAYTQQLPNNISIVNDEQFPNPRELQIGDFNGDGYDDVLTVRVHTSGGVSELSDVRIYYTNVNTNGTLSSTHTIYYYGAGGGSYEVDITKPFIRVGDFDGDNRSDFAVFSNVSQPSITIDFPAKNIRNVLSLNATQTYNGAAENVMVTDINGDGKNELMLINHAYSTFTRVLEISVNPSTNSCTAVQLLETQDFTIKTPNIKKNISERFQFRWENGFFSC